MKIKPFKLEQYFEKYEFSARYLLSSSDCDGFSLNFLKEQFSVEEKRLWDNLRLGYTESKGLPLLRETIASKYNTINHEDVLVLSPGEANFIFMNIVLEKGDHVICMSPAYQSLYQVADNIGCEIGYWLPDESTWKYHVEDLKTLIRPDTKAIIVNFPHNPTGFIPSGNDLDLLIRIAAEKNLFIFSDEMYRHLNLSEDEIPSLCDLYDNAVSLWGLTKSFGLAGLRLGWIVTRNQQLLREILAFKDYLTICNNAMSEILAITALRNAETLIGINLKKIQANLILFDEFQSAYRDFIDFIRPKAGSTAFVRLHLNEPCLDYCEKLVKETGIMLVPSEMFNYGNRHVRIGFGRKNLPEILSIWSDYISKNRK
ncbi:MAG: aminotransferase class I/II-fold pyridoxal phosphate-dependent enzyme [Bacteroidota bacterium]